MASLYVIKREARAQGLSRKELSKLSGVSQGTISSIFSGKTNPGEETLKKLTIAVFGGTSVAESLPQPDPLIPRYSIHLVNQVAEILNIQPVALRRQIRRGEHAWGRALTNTPGRQTYMIDREMFREETGITLELQKRTMKKKEATDGEAYEGQPAAGQI